MAVASEIQSLEQINYKSRIKVYIYPVLLSFIFTMAFLNYFPIGDQLKAFMKKNLAATGCNLDYESIGVEFLLPKVVVRDLTLPARCLGQMGEPLKFQYLNINFHFISFAPFGIPFKIETEMNGQPLALYFVQGFGQRVVRLKDQSINLQKISPLMGNKVKLAGTVTVDLNAALTPNNQMKSLSVKAQSRNFVLPPQNIEGFSTPKMKVNDLFLEANLDSPSRLTVDRVTVGDTDSPMRANFKGFINLQQGNMLMSQMNLTGEIAFSDSFKQTVPLAELFFQKFTQKDGFYQIRLGGTLGRPMMMNP